ncbi:hypothetical protein CRM82_17115 [Comamonas terrigena]|uniref:Transmembrane protein n=1 Tax=Comamonas terrigena TaxID=32013 RepID=A0A2A7UXV5_COMTR|nr:hypothetical protein [Comamonas terrigena]PEH90083.1 hypothetical protein CRM82_17115 [Comamonas terrigena]
MSSLSGASPVFAASGQGKRFVYVRSVLLDVSAVFLQHHPYIGHAAGGSVSVLHRKGAAHTGRCVQLAWLVVLGFLFVVHACSVGRGRLGHQLDSFPFQGGR